MVMVEGDGEEREPDDGTTGADGETDGVVVVVLYKGYGGLRDLDSFPARRAADLVEAEIDADALTELELDGLCDSDAELDGLIEADAALD